MDNNIPLDIISDILVRLPIKSIGRFRCVSKPWLCLISEPRFVEEHLHRSIDDNIRVITGVGIDDHKIVILNPSQLQVVDSKGEVRETFTVVDSGLPSSGRGVDGFTRYQIYGSCHGLVLVDVVDVGGDDTFNTTTFVFNPCTRDFRQLPKLDNITSINNHPIVSGIGYDSSSDDYKVLMYGNIFSLRSNSWRKTTFTPTACDVLYEEGVFINGSLHWIISRDESNYMLLTFDLETEQYLEPPQLQLPLIPNHCSYEKFFVMGENLSLFIYEMYQFEHQVWVMKKNGVELAWAKSFVVHAWCDYNLRPICLLKSGELVIFSDDFKLIIYNPKDETDKIVYYPECIWLGFDYNESLVSPYRGSRLGGQ